MIVLHFDGWWAEDEKADCIEPWETFDIVLFGREAGDTVDGPDEIKAVLAASGYEIVLRHVGDEPITAAALERAGWERISQRPEPIRYMKRCSLLSGNLTVIFYDNGGWTVVGPGGCKIYADTMSDLRTLIRLLGGGE